MSFLYVAYGLTAVLLLAQAWSLVGRLRRAEREVLRMGEHGRHEPVS